MAIRIEDCRYVAMTHRIKGARNTKEENKIDPFGRRKMVKKRTPPRNKKGRFIKRKGKKKKSGKKRRKRR